MRHLQVLLALSLAGCDCQPKPLPDAGVDAGEPLRGDVVDRYLLPAGMQPAAQKLAVRSITAWVELGDGTFATYPGVGADDGTFQVPQLPSGPYLIKLGDTVVSTDARPVHLGSNRLGRPDTFSAARGEGVELSLSNLAPWTVEDELLFVSWGAGLGYFSTAQRAPSFGSNGPDAGDTSLDASVVDFEALPVVEAARGDDFTILQLSYSEDGGVKQRVATRAFSPSITLALGTMTPVRGAFSTLPLVDGDFQFRAGEFTRWQPQVGPGAQAYVARLLIDVHPGPFGQSTHTGGTPDLAIVELPPDGGDARVQVRYGNPFPTSWRPFVSAGAMFDVQYRLGLPDGGLSLPRSEVGYVTTGVTLEEAAAAPLAPRISPLRSVTIDGQDATQPLTGVGLNPLVAWQLPELGTVSRVELEVVELAVAQSGGTKRVARDLLRVIGPKTSARLPPGFLKPGATYFLRLTALALPPEYSPASPLIDVGPPAAAAAMLTAAFSTR